MVYKLVFGWEWKLFWIVEFEEDIIWEEIVYGDFVKFIFGWVFLVVVIRVYFCLKCGFLELEWFGGFI